MTTLTTPATYRELEVPAKPIDNTIDTRSYPTSTNLHSDTLHSLASDLPETKPPHPHSEIHYLVLESIAYDIDCRKLDNSI